jgi:hypothetical protein
MKKIQTLLAAFLIISFTAFSQSTKRQSTDHTQIVKLGLNTFFDTDEFPFSISWEKKIGDNQSLQIGFLPRFRSYENDKTNGIGFNVAYRKYVSKNRTGINGLFISPIAKIGFLKEENSYSYNVPPQVISTKNTTNITQFSAGFVFGQNWVFKSGFSFEASGGIAYYNSTNKYSNLNAGTQLNNTDKEAGLLPQVQISFGYAF